jgi:hypothetical protein
MAAQATMRKVKRSFTLAPESVIFLSETRRLRGAASDSEALDLLLQDGILEAKRQQLDAACKAYYDTASDEELAGQLEWAEMAGPSGLLSAEQDEVCL